MKKYEKFPEIYNLYNSLNIYKNSMRDLKKEVVNTKLELHNKNQKFKEIKSTFNKIEKEKLKELHTALNIALLNAKYSKTNINQLYENYENDKNNLKNEYIEKKEKRINKTSSEIEMIKTKIQTLMEQCKEIKIKIKSTKVEIKEKWVAFEDSREQQEQKLKIELNDIKNDVRKNIKKIKFDFKNKENDILNTWKKENDSIKNYNSILSKQKKRKLKPFKNEDEEKIYDLSLSLNSLKIDYKKQISLEKEQIKNKKLDIRYNKGKAEPVSFDLVVNQIIYGSGKLSNWKFMIALKNGFFSLMPLVIVGAVFILINNILLSSGNGGLFNFFDLTVDQIEILNKLKNIGSYIWNGTYAFFAFLLAGAIAFHLAPYYKVSQWSAAVVSMSSFLIMNPTFWGDLGVFGTTGMFTAIIISMISTIIYGNLFKNEKLKIKMPDSVPEGVSKSFNVLIPYAITFTIFGLIAFGISEIGSLVGEIQVGSNTVTFSSINGLIVVLIQKPLVNVVSGFGGMIVIVLVWQLLWFLGIHAGGILSPIIEPIQLDGLTQNQQAIAEGANPEYVFTNPFMNNFIHIGGTGGTIALIFAILVFSKRGDYRTMAKMTLIPALFCVNEPLLFGLPIVLNPILFIPFIVGPLLAGMFAYFATVTGMMEYSSVVVPWTTPPILGGFLATKDIWGALVVVINLGILVGCYSPFVILANKIEQRELLSKFSKVENLEEKNINLNQKQIMLN